jgi:chromosome segregation ATPase
LDSTLRDYENKIALLTTEIERLSDININRANQIEEWKKRALQLESQLTSLNSVDEDNRRLREFLEQTKRERDESRQSIIKLERDNYDL